ncbi:MAG: hypothetical protein ACI9NQ_001976 [Paracoccaceae bacterium]|jgi:hypothetical protein
MDPEAPLTLDHDIPAPETYLPGTPEWVWWSGSMGIVLAIILLWLLVKFLRRPKAGPPVIPKRDFYAAASKSLRSLEKNCESLPLAEVAAHSSLAIRGYLAGSMSEPALYETVEEFKARQPNLPREAEALLTDLNAAKYSKSTIAPEQARDFVARSKQCLKTIHAAHTVTS